MLFCLEKIKAKSSKARSLSVENLLPQFWGKWSTTFSNLLKWQNGEPLVAVDHNQLREMASETVDPIQYLLSSTYCTVQCTGFQSQDLLQPLRIERATFGMSAQRTATQGSCRSIYKLRYNEAARSTIIFNIRLFSMRDRANAVNRYQRLCTWVIHIWDNRNVGNTGAQFPIEQYKGWFAVEIEGRSEGVL